MIAQIDLQVQVQVPQDTLQPQTQDTQNTDSFRSLLQGMQAKSTEADTGATDKVSGDSGKADLKKDAKAGTASSLPQASQAILAQAAQAGYLPQAPVSPIPAPAQASQLTAVQAVPQTAVPLADAMARKASPDGSSAVQSQAVVTAQVPKNIPAASQQNMAPEAVQVSQNIPAANKAVEAQQIPQNVPTAPRQSTAAETVQVPQNIPTAAKQSSTAPEIAKVPQSTAPDAAQALQNIPAASGQNKVSGIATVTDSTAPAAQPSARANQVLAVSGETPTAETGKAPAEEKLPNQENGTPSTQPVPTFYTSGRVIVKVSDAPAAAKTPVGSQIANAVTDGLKAGKQQFQVDLYPQSLGKVSVNLVSQNGMLTIEIAAQNPKTQSLIASSSGEIRSLLHASTGQNVQVTNQQQNAQQYTGQNGNPYQQQQFSQQQQQQQQDAEQRQSAARWYAAGNSSGFSTGDFLAAMRKAAV